MAVINVFAYNLLSLSQAVDSNYKIVQVQHDLRLADSVSINMKVVHVESQLYFSHSAVSATTFNVSASHALALSQATQRRVFIKEVEQRLMLGHEALALPKWPLVRQSLALTQTVDVEVAKGLYSVLALAHEATYTITRNLSVDHTLTLVSDAAGYLPSKFWTSFPVVLEETI